MEKSFLKGVLFELNRSRLRNKIESTFVVNKTKHTSIPSIHTRSCYLRRWINQFHLTKNQYCITALSFLTYSEENFTNIFILYQDDTYTNSNLMFVIVCAVQHKTCVIAWTQLVWNLIKSTDYFALHWCCFAPVLRVYNTIHAQVFGLNLHQ